MNLICNHLLSVVGWVTNVINAKYIVYNLPTITNITLTKHQPLLFMWLDFHWLSRILISMSTFSRQNISNAVWKVLCLSLSCRWRGDFYEKSIKSMQFLGKWVTRWSLKNVYHFSIGTLHWKIFPASLVAQNSGIIVYAIPQQQVDYPVDIWNALTKHWLCMFQAHSALYPCIYI